MARERTLPYQASIQAKKLEVLELIHNKNSIKEIAEHRNTTYQAAHKAVRRLINDKLITVKRGGFYLTASGKKALKGLYGKQPVGSYQRQRNLIRLHDLQFQLKVLSPSHWNTGLQKIFNLKKINYTLNDKLGWTKPQYIFYVDTVEVRTTPNYVLILPNDIYGKTASDAKNAATTLLYQIIPKVENILRVQLNREGKVSIKVTRQHNALIYNEIAEWFLKNKLECLIYDERGDLRLIVDDSLKLKELEAVHKRYAEQDADRLKTFLSEVTMGDISLNDINTRIEKLALISENLAKANVSMLTGINTLLTNKLTEMPLNAPELNIKDLNGYIG